MAMTLKQNLRDGKSVLGTMLSLTCVPNMAYLLRNARYDFIFVDCEHGPFTTREVSNLVALCRAIDLGVVIRVCQPDRQSIQKYSDMGIDGIMIPMAEDPASIKQAANYARYAPRGIRGMGLGPLVDFNTGMDLVKCIEDLNENYIILTQIESRAGVDNIDAIMALDGVDGCFFGVYDMSISYGIPGQIYDPIFRQNILTVLKAARRHGKILGHHFFGYEDLEWGLENGIKLVTFHTDVSALQEFYSGHAKTIRGLPGFGS